MFELTRVMREILAVLKEIAANMNKGGTKK